MINYIDKYRNKYKKISLEGEIWRDVVGYEGYYLVSNRGRVISQGKKRPFEKSRQHMPRLLKTFFDRAGYERTKITDIYGKIRGWYIHQLVAKAFLENPNNYTDVNHIDENKSNNCVENLMWMSHKENCNYGNRNRISSSKIKKVFEDKEKIISLDTGKVYNNIYELGEYLGLNLANYHEYKKNKSKLLK